MSHEESYEDLHAKLYPFAAQKQEYITCAAIWYNDGKDYEHQPKNIELGFVAAGHRHHNVIALIYRLHPDRIRDQVQGFLTSKDRFVTREEAYLIAKEAGQIKDRESKSILFSEDIY